MARLLSLRWRKEEAEVFLTWMDRMGRIAEGLASMDRRAAVE
jgi:hypothetical protein